MQNLRICNCLGIYSFFRKVFKPRTQTFLDPILIILTQMDFLNDMILVVRLITLLGGIVVFKNPHRFSSNVSKFNERELPHFILLYTYPTLFR